MSEKEPHSVAPRPEEILTTQEAEVLQKAEAGVLPCPCCGQTLRAEMIVSADYEGVLLSCSDRGGCGFRECVRSHHIVRFLALVAKRMTHWGLDYSPPLV
jgi:hypothetical protein